MRVPVVTVIGLLVGVFCLGARSAAQAATPEVVPSARGAHGVDWPMFNDPAEDPLPVDKVFRPRLAVLWGQALARPEVELRRQAAEAIIKAHREGMKGLDTLIPALRRVLRDGGTPGVAQDEAALALIELDDRASAEDVLKLMEHTPSWQVELLDAGLARWDYAPARAVWRARLDQAQSSASGRSSAARCLGLVHDEDAAGALEKLVRQASTEPMLRLAAAEALAQLAQAPVVPLARTVSRGDLLDRVCAAKLLTGRKDDGALQLDHDLLEDPSPAVVAVALANLLQVAPARISAADAARLAGSPDANVRRLAAQALVQESTAEAVVHLADLLADENPMLRCDVREWLVTMAGRAELRQAVIDAARRHLDGAAWRGQEEAAYLVGSLDCKECADRLLDLMVAPHLEVRLAACTALRRLAVPATFARMLARARDLAHQSSAAVEAAAPPAGKGQAGPLPDRAARAREALEAASIGQEMAQLIQTFGPHDYKPAEGFLRSLVPKNMALPDLGRAAAIWSLGFMYPDDKAAKLGSILAGRLSDLSPMMPESQNVRSMSAVTIGRLRARAGLAAVEQFYKDEASTVEIGGMCRWAIMRITGQTLPPLPHLVDEPQGWFLEPLERN